jgi:hypothetical protein
MSCAAMISPHLHSWQYGHDSVQATPRRPVFTYTFRRLGDESLYSL